MLTHFDQHPHVVTQEVNIDQGDASHLIKQIRLMIYMYMYVFINRGKYNKVIVNMKYLFED